MLRSLLIKERLQSILSLSALETPSWAVVASKKKMGGVVPWELYSSASKEKDNRSLTL
jgi:hypothetical protein